MNKTMFAVTALAAFAILALSSVYAHQFGYMNNVPAIDREGVEDAIESGDYAAWKSMHQGMNGRMASLITEDNFHLLQEMHEAREAGDYKKMMDIKSELGFSSGNGRGMGMMAQSGFRAGYANCPMH